MQRLELTTQEAGPYWTRDARTSVGCGGMRGAAAPPPRVGISASQAWARLDGATAAGRGASLVPAARQSASTPFASATFIIAGARLCVLLCFQNTAQSEPRFAHLPRCPEHPRTRPARAAGRAAQTAQCRVCGPCWLALPAFANPGRHFA